MKKIHNVFAYYDSSTLKNVKCQVIALKKILYDVMLKYICAKKSMSHKKYKYILK